MRQSWSIQYYCLNSCQNILRNVIGVICNCISWALSIVLNYTRQRIAITSTVTILLLDGTNNKHCGSLLRGADACELIGVDELNLDELQTVIKL